MKKCSLRKQSVDQFPTNIFEGFRQFLLELYIRTNTFLLIISTQIVATLSLRVYYISIYASNYEDIS